MLSNPVDGGWNSSLICLLFHPGRRLNEVSVCDPPCLLAACDECHCQWDPDLLLLTGEQWGLVS